MSGGRGARARAPALPQEAVTPTRRDLRNTNVDWIPVSEYNSRVHNRSRKPINALPENNEYVELESHANPESSNRFVPVRPQPRTLVLRQRDMMENQEEASYNPVLSGHSPHTNHAAIMIVNPTTPNTNLPNQNLNMINGHSNDNRVNSKNICSNHDQQISTSVVSTLVGPFPNSSKSSNICDNQDLSHHAGQSNNMNNDIQNSENMLSHTKIARTMADTLVSACPDTSRVEQRLGQIQEYIRVTASLVDSMRNSEDELRNRLASLRRSNQILTEAICQDENNSDLDELEQTLKDLRDSENKLKGMLQTTLSLTEANDEDEKSKVNLHVEMQNKVNDIKTMYNTLLDNGQSEKLSIVDISADEKDAPENSSVVNNDIVNVSDNLENSSQDAPRSYSVQSGGSVYSDNDLWQNEFDAKAEVSQLQAAFQEQQKKLLKYQAELREKAAEALSSNDNFENIIENGSNCLREQSSNIHQPLTVQNTSRAFSSNQIGVATTLPHIIDDKDCVKNQLQFRQFDSNDQDLMESSTSRHISANRTKDVSNLGHTFVSEADMLKDLKMRRQHLENQVAKIQSLHAATASLVESVASEQCSVVLDNNSMKENGMWEESEGSIPEDDSIAPLNTLKSKMEAVNVVKVELERLKSMLRTVDSIQNNFGINSAFEDDNSFGQPLEASQENQAVNHNRLSESPFNNTMRNKVEPISVANVAQNISQSPKNPNVQHGLPRLQNCIVPGTSKCTNVNDQLHQRDNMNAGLATIQQLTQKMKEEAQDIANERQRIKYAFNRDANNSRASSVKSDDKNRSNSIEKSSHIYASEIGPLERKQLALKAELEAKKKQLERLMSKEVDHRTNQQVQPHEIENTNKTPCSTSENEFACDSNAAALQHPPNSDFNDSDICVFPCPLRSDGDNGYSSDQDGEDEYAVPQVNINQLHERCVPKRSSQSSSVESFKINYNDTSHQSTENISQNLKQKNNHNNIFEISNTEKQRNKDDVNHEPRNSRESSQRQRSNSHRAESNILPSSQPLAAGLPLLPPNSSQVALLKKVLSSQSKSINPSGPMDANSQLDSGSSSGDQDPTDMPNPMPKLLLRHTVIKDDEDTDNVNDESQQWQNAQSESHMTMWWHNKANQLQQQLEMINNLCQSLLQDRPSTQSPPSTSNNVSHTSGNTIMPNFSNAFMMPYAFGSPCVAPPMGDQMSIPWWAITQQQQLALQQQQLAAQQQQLAASSWDNSQCIQHLLSQQREISSLKSSINNLEEKLHMLNMTHQSSHAQYPNLANIEMAPMVAPSARDNASLSRPQMQCWNQPNASSLFHIAEPPQQANECNAPWLPQANRHNLYHHNRSSFPAKKTPMIPPYPGGDHVNVNAHAPPNMSQAILNDQLNNLTVPNNLNIGNQPGGIVFNNCIPSNHMNSAMLNNHQQTQNNMNSNSFLNLTSHPTIHNPHTMAMHTMSGGNTQTLTGQNMALNNQVPPGNRANNYWDNFRSYSRQNLLSGSKTNAESVTQSHSHHPLTERSHNTLHLSSSTILPQSQAANTPKRNLNNQIGYATVNQIHNPNLQIDSLENNTRGRRNLSNEVTFNTPPDVLNVNDSAVTTNAPLNIEDGSTTRTNNSVNLNINRTSILDSDVASTQPSSNNLNTPRLYGNQKKKSSSKLPAKNSANNGNFSLETVHLKNVQSTPDSDIADLNLASTSSVNKQKSTAKLFDLLRENVYSEVSALISANESRPHFLIQLFRDLQQISSDALRQRTLQSIQELVTRYLATVEMDSYGASEDQKNVHRVSSSTEGHTYPGSTTDEAGIFSLDTNNEIVRFIFAHHSDPCSSEVLQSIRSIIYSVAGNIPKKIDDGLLACFNKYPDSKLMDIGDEIVMIMSGIVPEPKNKTVVNVGDLNESFSNTVSSVGDQAIANNPQLLVENDNNVELCSHENAEANFAIISEMPSCSTSSKHVEMNPENSACSSSYNASSSELKIDLIESVETCNGDLAEADQSRHGNESINSTGNIGFENLPDIVDMDEQTPTEAEAEWLRMDRITIHMESESSIESHDTNQ